ncbi:MAG: ribulose-phosphate 3-epimerase [Deltaproteobacteria bacterium CG11_big_fil_rev_8_21_14_0_20_47_16]|nr:MAG: ribulose-phosphate 3-epimerase [Deltaproteobacteria bacterium CG11_big_fil_rev_8_21_14_0_20_47_16]
MIQIAPSILAADFAKLGDEIRAIEAAGADIIHWDIMDGHYNPNLTFGPPVIAGLRNATQLPFDAHLMVTNPDAIIEDVAKAGCQMISVHVETCDPKVTLPAIQKLGCKAGIVVDAKTPVEELLPYLPLADYVLVMTVQTGYAGQKMIPDCLEKMKIVRDKLKELNHAIPIQADGGVTPDTLKLFLDAGASILVAGNAVFKSGDYAKAIQQLKS